ncbi:phosphotransferase (plasmid) [Embleya sp. NBC_00888]|uniref:hypothetical protein n=1 Tax=Embleya sp. NBC_00888 TaxID=2975960 RepID=UPI0038643249|nr:phosphotransferase [Embleya sp. NBC_00888]
MARSPPVRRLPARGPTLDRDRDLHEQAGRLPRRRHDHGEPASEHDRAAERAAAAEEAEEASGCLGSTAGYLDDAQRALVRCVVDELPRLVEEVPVVYRHGDHATRNRLWDAARYRVGVIGRGRALRGPALWV